MISNEKSDLKFFTLFQSDTSIDSEDSCVSVIFVPHPENRLVQVFDWKIFFDLIYNKGYVHK
jgi:hypothetical protein